MDPVLRALDALDSTIRPLYCEYSRRFWDMSRKGEPGDVEALVDAKRQYLSVYNDPETFLKLKAWRDDSANLGLDPLTARRLERTYQTFIPYQMRADALTDIVQRETRIENAFNTYRADFEGSHISDNRLRDLLRVEVNPERRRRLWEASKQVGIAVAPDLRELVQLRNQEARLLGFRDYYQLMLETAELSEEWLFSLLDELEEASGAAFTTMKAGMDEKLRIRFGIEGSGSWPWMYDDPFFQELPTAEITERLDGVFRHLDIEELTESHFRSLGMEIGDLLERADLYEREGKSQHAFCLDVDREGDVRVLCNLKPDERWMSTMLHEFGHAVYDKYTDRSLPFSLREPAHVLTTEAVAMLNGRMTKSPSWLERFAGVSRDEAQQIGPAAFGAMRASMLIFLRWALTLVRFERELYRDPSQDLDSLWWDLAGRIQQVRCPPGRSSPDWASKIHLAVSPVYYQNYILGELMASQLMNYLQTSVASSGDIFDPSAGAYLVNRIFEPGARWHWNEMLERATGEGLTPRHFLKQFRIADAWGGD